jgi:hypothetical protein
MAHLTDNFELVMPYNSALVNALWVRVGAALAHESTFDNTAHRMASAAPFSRPAANGLP